jgi:hypothetical protein
MEGSTEETMKRLRIPLQLALAAMLVVLLAGVLDVRGAAAANVAVDKETVKVTVVILPASAPANNFVYDIIATNQGDDWARNTTITVPYESDKLSLVDVQFQGDRGWVKERGANTFVIQIARLNPGNKTTATVRFAKLPSATTNTGLTERATYAWLGGDVTVGGNARTNIPAPVALSVYPMDVSQIAGEDKPTQRFTAGYFVPNEPVSFWCNMPDGTIHPLLIGHDELVALEHKISNFDKENHKYGEYMRADENGSITINLPPEHLSPGTYSVVAYGHWTGLSALGAFEFK